MGLLRMLPARLLDYALPPRCPACGGIVPGPQGFCMDCWRGLDFLGGPACGRCGVPLADAWTESCADCAARPPGFDTVRAAVAYGPAARTMALRLKYGGRTGLAAGMARLMRRHLDADGVLLVPVPLGRWRLWRRGYNQAALIARALARMSGAEMAPDLLRRTRATPPLRGMSRAERARTVRGAFRAGPAAAGRHVVLVDDVLTSGATADACARALRDAGAARVDVLCWARVTSPGVER